MRESLHKYKKLETHHLVQKGGETDMRSFVSENVFLSRNELESIFMKENRNRRIAKGRLINVATSKCKSCKSILSESVLNNYHYEELGSSSVKIITCPHCGMKQATAYIQDNSWNEYELAL